MIAMPRGNEPVLFSRRANSIVLSPASIVSGSMPVSANPASVSRTRVSTFSASAESISFNPVENVAWRSSLDRPFPAMPPPRPESMSALCNGAADVPTRM